MAFDPSVIGGIADSAVQSQKDALTLRGLADRDQLAQLEVQNAKSDAADNNKLKSLFQTMPHSSQAEMNSLLEKASQEGVDPQRVMKLQRDSQVLAEGNADVELKKIQVAQQQAAPMVSAFDTVLGQLQPFKTMVDQGKMTQAELDAITMQRALPQIQQLAKEHPELAPHLGQYLQNPQALTYQGLTTQEASFSQGRAMMDERQKTLKAALDERREDTSERREDTNERREQAYEKTQLSLASARDKKAAIDGGFGDPKIQALQAAIASSGYSPPAGFRSAKQQLGMYQGLLKKYDGFEPEEIADLLASKAIDYNAEKKATSAAATIVGKIEVANNELEGFVPIAREASANVPRGSFMPFNKLEQLGREQINDPAQKKLFVATQTILNAYDQLASRGGTDKDKRAENRKILETANSPEAYGAALDMIVREGQVAGAAARKATKASSYKDDNTGEGKATGGGAKDFSYLWK
jgi:hypothetical protein